MSEPISEPAQPAVVDTIGSPVIRPAGKLATAVGRTTIAVVFALLLGSAQSLTAPAAILIIGAGFTAWVLWFSVPVTTTARWPAARCPGISVWITIAAVFGGVELAAYVLGDDQEHPTFSRLVDPLLSSPLTRTLAGLGWIVWGRHLAGLVPRAVEEGPTERADSE